MPGCGSISRSVDQSALADWQCARLRWGGHVDLPLCRPKQQHGSPFFSFALLVVSSFVLRFLSALTILIYFLFTFFLNLAIALPSECAIRVHCRLPRPQRFLDTRGLLFLHPPTPITFFRPNGRQFSISSTVPTENFSQVIPFCGRDRPSSP